MSGGIFLKCEKLPVLINWLIGDSVVIIVPFLAVTTYRLYSKLTVGMSRLSFLINTWFLLSQYSLRFNLTVFCASCAAVVTLRSVVSEKHGILKFGMWLKNNVKEKIIVVQCSVLR